MYVSRAELIERKFYEKKKSSRNARICEYAIEQSKGKFFFFD